MSKQNSTDLDFMDNLSIGCGFLFIAVVTLAPCITIGWVAWVIWGGH